MANSEWVLPALIAVWLVWYIKHFHLKHEGLYKCITVILGGWCLKISVPWKCLRATSQADSGFWSSGIQTPQGSSKYHLWSVNMKSELLLDHLCLCPFANYTGWNSETLTMHRGLCCWVGRGLRPTSSAAQAPHDPPRKGICRTLGLSILVPPSQVPSGAEVDLGIKTGFLGGWKQWCTTSTYWSPLHSSRINLANLTNFGHLRVVQRPC